METVIGGGMFVLGKQIGGGSFGTVYQGKFCAPDATINPYVGELRETNKKVAIKMEPHKSHYLKHEYDLLISLQDIGKLLPTLHSSLSERDQVDVFSWHPKSLLVWQRKRLQYSGDGAAGPQSRIN
jgi:hypothetical protein